MSNVKILTYNTYMELLSAIDEHTNCRYSHNWCAKAIYEHYTKDGRWFIVENKSGQRAVFHGSVWRSRLENNRCFMQFKNYIEK